ncbi:MAG: hypothetical protein ACXAEF_10210, partial [Candidatus Thorarchaeota archaeon]
AATKVALIEDQQQNKTPRYYSLLLSYIILSMVGMLVVSAVGVVFATINTGYSVIVFYLPHMLLIEFCFMLLLCPVVAFLSQIIDEPKRTAFAGLILFLGLLLSTGIPPSSTVDYPDLALFGPANLFAALMFILIGGFGEWSISHYVGVEFTLPQLIPPILAYLTLSILASLIARYFFHENLIRWELSSGDWLKSSKDVPEVQVARTLSNLNTQFKSRQKIVGTIVVIVILMIPLLSMSYVNYRYNEASSIIYQSPSGGEVITIGEWKFGDFQGHDIGDNQYLVIHCEGEILEGGGTSDETRFNFEHREMTLLEFQGLNETEIEDIFGSGETGNYGPTMTFHGGWSGPIRNDHYVWGLRFLEVKGQMSGSIRINLRVTLTPGG